MFEYIPKTVSYAKELTSVYICCSQGNGSYSWYGHRKGGWKLQGKKLGSAQYTRDENAKLLRKLEEIHARWRRYFTSLLNTTSAALNQTMIEGLSEKPTALSLGDPPVVSETNKGLRSMASGKAMGPDELQAELLKLRLSDSSHESCSHSTASS